MKLKSITVLLLSCSFAFGQNYKTIVAEAYNLYSNKEYKQALSKYKQAFEIDQKNESDSCTAGCTTALLGDKKLAFE